MNLKLSMRAKFFLSTFLTLNIFSANNAYAMGSNNAEYCSLEAEEAAKAGVYHLLVSFEGLLIPSKGVVYKNIDRKLASATESDFVLKPYRYSQSKKAIECTYAWKKVLGSKLKISVLGHSFGGGIATQLYIAALDEQNIEIETVITMDPRDSSSPIFSCPNPKPGYEKYHRYANVKNYINFYQCGRGLPGEHIAGAQNIRINNRSHGGLPGSPEILETAKKYILKK